MIDKREASKQKRILRNSDIRKDLLRRDQRRCFWTWPWGHVYESYQPHEFSTGYQRCPVCGKIKYTAY